MPSLQDSKVGYVGTNTSVTASAIVPAGINRLGLVKAAWFAVGDISSVTWGGVDITANVIKNAVHDGSNRKRMCWFYILSPPASSADVVVTKADAATAMTVVAEAWDGVDQVTPYGDLTATADGSQQTADPSSLTVTADSGKIITDAHFMWGSSATLTGWTVGGDQTEIQASLRNFGGGANSGHFGTSYATSDGSVDMIWNTDPPTSPQWAMYAVSLNAAGGGSPPALMGQAIF